jgi:hypothetical protein
MPNPVHVVIHDAGGHILPPPGAEQPRYPNRRNEWLDHFQAGADPVGQRQRRQMRRVRAIVEVMPLLAFGDERFRMG